MKTKQKPTSHHGYTEDECWDNVIFVFGSNLAGVHGAGAARDAYEFWGAEWGCGAGMAGYSYAIPTKDHTLATLPLHVIDYFVNQFLVVAAKNPHREYQVTAIGCGLAGYENWQIAPLFRNPPKNVHLPLAWKSIIPFE